MKYIKIFESFQSEPKFYRFTKEDFLEGQEEAIYTPKKRTLWGYTSYNDMLIELGFPDRERCIHFMDNRFSADHYNRSKAYMASGSMRLK